MIKEMEDTELIQNILNGNQIAQEELYNKYKNSVRNYLKNKFSLYYDLDDDVSEIMVKVFMNLNTYNSSKSKFMSWVFSIAKNHMIDKWRNNTCTTTLATNGCITYTTTSNIDTENLNTAFTSTSINTDFENCSSINYLSEQLTPQDYTLLDMKYVQGYDYNEIGMEFNLTSSTISNRVNYIKTKLKKNNPEIIYE